MNPLVARYAQIVARLGDIRIHRAQLELEAEQLEAEGLAIQGAMRLLAPAPAPSPVEPSTDHAQE